MRFKDQVVLVTGSSQGIGKAVALRFASEGARVAVVARASLAKAEGVAAEIRGLGGCASAHVCDVIDPARIRDLVRGVTEAHGPIDTLVNVAGVDYRTPLLETSEADFDRMIDTNLKGMFFMMQAVAPGMIERRRGKIINMSSVCAVMPVGGRGVYCATKAGISMLTRVMAWELGPAGINVNAIAPGNTMTPEHAAKSADPKNREILRYYEMNTPSPRTYSSADDIAGGVLFLASPEASGMFGATLLYDEGISCGLSGRMPSGEFMEAVSYG